MSDAPPPRTGEKDDVVRDRKRPWTKPRIRTMRLVNIGTGVIKNPAYDEDALTSPAWKNQYAPVS